MASWLWIEEVMGIGDTEASARPLGVDMAHRGEYKPPKVLRRGDIPPPKETVRDLLIKALKTGNQDWESLCQAAKAHPHEPVSAALTQLLKEELVALTPEGKFVFVPPVSQTKTPAAQAEKAQHDTITTRQKVASKSTLDGLKLLIMVLANRSFEAEERYQRLLQDTHSELQAERQARLILQNKILATFEGR